MRKKAGMTQEQLAEAIGMSREVLARIETGKNGTSVDSIINFANYFKVTIDYLLGLINDNPMIEEITKKIELVSDDKKELLYKCVMGLIDNFI